MASVEILQRFTIGDAFGELVFILRPIGVVVLVGLLVIGLVWKPKWVNLGREKSNLGFSLIPGFNSFKGQWPNCIAWISNDKLENEILERTLVNSDCRSSSAKKENSVVTRDDVEHLCQLVEEKDGGPAWIHMMDRSTPTMTYQAWRRDPKTGPPQYRSSTVYEDATPELVRDFFWDDEFRSKWDNMLLHTATLEECPTTGTMVVHWIRKFPFFCSDREYTIGRRIWESGRAYYCVTKGVPCPSVPRRKRPRRVDLYYSSWCIRAVESKRGDGQLTACEVLLFHHEDMGIPWEIAKLGVRQGMWGAVKMIEPGLRAYQMSRRSGAALSRSALMAHINTKINANYLRSLATSSDSSELETTSLSEKPWGRKIPKFLIVGGAVVLACSLDRGLLTKAVILGVARRFGKLGRRL
ncbi:uncharacterized protein LOC143876217 [Tasmannia lanceolata]|uniref:uncharacterized protein LOC143876217 n=1 Tax=Tasmannia lanceolata TaxID=3420 RepID=UPI0040648356